MTTTDSIHQEEKIVILGDLIIDETWFVETQKISPEAPVLVASILSSKPTINPGGAGLAASYAIKHMIPSLFMSTFSVENKALLKAKGVSIISLPSSQNVKKIRYIDKASGYHLIRVDTDKTVQNTMFNQEILLKEITDLFTTENISVLLVLDYDKGLFHSEKTCQQIINISKSYNIPVYVDTRADPRKFSGVDTIKLNSKELKKSLKKTKTTSVLELREALGIRFLIETQGEFGANLWFKNHLIHKDTPGLPGLSDVTGCGDVFDVNFCYNYYYKRLSYKESLEESVEKASMYAHTSIKDRL